MRVAHATDPKYLFAGGIAGIEVDEVELPGTDPDKGAIGLVEDLESAILVEIHKCWLE